MNSTLNFNEALEIIDRNLKVMALQNNVDFDELMKKAIRQETGGTLVPVEVGSLLARGILKNDDVAVSRLFAKAGTKLINHVHHEHELLRVIKGCLYLYIENKQVLILRDGDAAYLPINTKHSNFWPEDTEYIAVTVPGSHAFPEQEGVPPPYVTNTK